MTKRAEQQRGEAHGPGEAVHVQESSRACQADGVGKVVRLCAGLQGLSKRSGGAALRATSLNRRFWPEKVVAEMKQAVQS